MLVGRNRGRHGLAAVALLVGVLAAPVAVSGAAEAAAPALSAGTMRDLGTLSGGTSSVGRAINDQGQVAGYGDTADGSMHAFLWTP